VTGGPGVGKSTVVSFLANSGYTTVSADEVARGLVFGPLGGHVAALAGISVPFSAAELRERLFSAHEDAGRALRRKMNALLHRPILEEMLRTGASVWEVPLLIEAGLQAHFDEVWVVDCAPALQLERLEARYGGAGAAEALMATHLPQRVKKIFASEVVRTDQSLENVRIVTLELAQQAQERLARTWE
jgi:dephospho-CoA kinase